MVAQPQRHRPSSSSTVTRPFWKEEGREACASWQPLQDEVQEEGWEDTMSTSITLTCCEGARNLRVTSSTNVPPKPPLAGDGGQRDHLAFHSLEGSHTSENDFLPLFCLESAPRCSTPGTGAAFLLMRCCPPSRWKGLSQREKSRANLGCVAFCRLYWVNRENRVSK